MYRKTFSILTALILVLILAAIPAYAKVGEEYIRWSNGKFEIPDDIKQADCISKLQPFFHDKDEFKRMAAIRRLGEIEDGNAVKLLYEIFTSQPPTRGLDTIPIVKLEIIRVLGCIGGDEAKSVLLYLLESYWTRGPQVENKKYFYHDPDFVTPAALILNELCKWYSDGDVFQKAKNIAFSEDLASFYPFTVMADNVWVLYLKGYMPRQGIEGQTDSAKYLLNFMQDTKSEYNRLGAAKKRAAETILEQYSEAVLSALQKDLEQELAEIPHGPENYLEERRYRLRAQIGYIKQIALRKKEATTLNKPVFKENKKKVKSSLSLGDVLKVTSCQPSNPAVLRLGERLNVKVLYKLQSMEKARVWARPYINGNRAGGYRAHPLVFVEKTDDKPDGIADCWFSFNRPAKIDEVRVFMQDTKTDQIVKEISYKINARWAK